MTAAYAGLSRSVLMILDQIRKTGTVYIFCSFAPPQDREKIYTVSVFSCRSATTCDWTIMAIALRRRVIRHSLKGPVMLTLSLFSAVFLSAASGAGEPQRVQPAGANHGWETKSWRLSAAQKRLRERRTGQGEGAGRARSGGRGDRPYRWEDSYDADYRRAQAERDAARADRRAQSEARRADAKPYRWEDSYDADYRRAQAERDAARADRRARSEAWSADAKPYRWEDSYDAGYRAAQPGQAPRSGTGSVPIAGTSQNRGDRRQGEWGYALGSGPPDLATSHPASSGGRSSVCGAYAGEARTACLHREDRRGEREIGAINVVNDAFAGAAAGTCDAREVIAAIESVTTGVVTGALKGTARTIGKGLLTGAAPAAVGEATGIPTSAVEAGAALGDAAYSNGGCTKRAR
jgi:hypothetical protein